MCAYLALSSAIESDCCASITFHDSDRADREGKCEACPDAVHMAQHMWVPRSRRMATYSTVPNPLADHDEDSYFKLHYVDPAVAVPP